MNNKLRERQWFVKASKKQKSRGKDEYLEERAHSCVKLRADSDALTASLRTGRPVGVAGGGKKEPGAGCKAAVSKCLPNSSRME